MSLLTDFQLTGRKFRNPGIWNQKLEENEGSSGYVLRQRQLTTAISYLFPETTLNRA